MDEKYHAALEWCRSMARDQGIDAALQEHGVDVLVIPCSGGHTTMKYTLICLTPFHTAKGWTYPCMAGYPSVTSKHYFPSIAQRCTDETPQCQSVSSPNRLPPITHSGKNTHNPIQLRACPSQFHSSEQRGQNVRSLGVLLPWNVNSISADLLGHEEGFTIELDQRHN